MRKKLLVTSIAFLGGLGMCSTASALITDSAHDFTLSTWAEGQICLPCHAPHNNQNTTGDLLWNHDPTLAVYALYDSPTFDIAVPGQPAALSKFCLSCHDGTIALDSYTNHVGATKISLTADVGPNLGTNLSNDHPVSFLYNGDLVTADTTTGGGVVGLVTPASTSEVVAGIPLFDGMMECASCHDVHNKKGTTKGDGLLNSVNTGSALCLKCHIK